tara:strand:- start:240 stop:416 length:177 start_codon:yes stop_codon:yes gene_type:complete
VPSHELFILAAIKYLPKKSIGPVSLKSRQKNVPEAFARSVGSQYLSADVIEKGPELYT